MTQVSAAATAVGRRLRVLVVFEPGRGGAEALRQAGEQLAAGAELSVVTLAPQADASRCCGPGAQAYNCGVREEAESELRDAREALGSAAREAHFSTLTGTPAPPLADWAAARGFDLILLPAVRFSRGGGRLARSLRRGTRAEIRLT